MTYMTVPNVKSKLQVEEFDRYEVTDGKEKVKKAAKFLDKIAPGWFIKVNLENFNMGCTDKCVLFYVFGNYHFAKVELVDVIGDDCSKDHVFSYFTGYWVIQIEKRKEKLNKEHMTVPIVKSEFDADLYSYESVKHGVKKAAKYLDKVAPGWFTKVDLLKFDMTDSSECVLGQVFGNYSSARDSLTYNTLLDHLFQGHTCEWREEIKKRIKNLKGE